MTDAIEQTGLTILGGAIAGLVGILVARWQRTFDARNEFRVFVSVAKGRIPQSGFIAFHNKSKIEVRDAVSRLNPSLCSSQIKAVELACTAYSDIDPKSLEDHQEEDWEWRNEALVITKEPIAPKPSDILKTHLDKLYASIA